MTDAQLSSYDGRDPSLPIYLALNGSIYDVSANREMYGPGGGYSFFAGRDAARAFVTGCFREDLTPDLRGAEEVFVPLELEAGNGSDEGGNKAEAKLRREKEHRKARQRVRDTIEGWQKMFSGEEGGKPYFKVGEVVREKDWLERLPRRELCEQARKSRPKFSAKDVKP